MLKFHVKSPTDSKIDEWIRLNQNVHLFGEKGTGKTSRILEGFDRNKLTYKYFSGATLDPWVHVIGVPKVKEKDGKEFLAFILPPELDDKLEAIFIDEYNRTPAVVRNALLELQQFKSINGRKFPKLRFIWAASNPPKDEEAGYNEDYDVEEIDPAQLDRFPVIIEVPNTPDRQYFKKKYGAYKANVLIEWWKQQSKESKKILSPRRLDYVGEYHGNGGDISDMLPVSCNIRELVKALSKDEKTAIIESILSNPDENTFEQFVKDEQNVLKYQEQLKEGRFWNFYHLMKPEFFDQLFANDEEFQKFAFYKAFASKHKDFYKQRILTYSNSSKSDLFSKTLAVLGANAQIVSMKEDNLPSLTTSATVLQRPANSGNGDDYVSKSYPFDRFNWNQFDASTVWRNLNTQAFRKFFANAIHCWKVLPINGAMSVMLAAYNSMQVGTIKKEKEFESLFGSLVVRAASECSKKDRESMVTYFQGIQKKLKSHDNLVAILAGTSAVSSGGDKPVIPQDFLNQLETTMQILKLSV